MSNTSARIKCELTVREWLKVHWDRKYGSARAAAKALGVSASYLSQVGSGQKSASARVLQDAGVTLVTVAFSEQITA